MSLKDGVMAKAYTERDKIRASLIKAMVEGMVQTLSERKFFIR